MVSGLVSNNRLITRRLAAGRAVLSAALGGSLLRSARATALLGVTALVSVSSLSSVVAPTAALGESPLNGRGELALLTTILISRERALEWPVRRERALDGDR